MTIADQKLQEREDFYAPMIAEVQHDARIAADQLRAFIDTWEHHVDPAIRYGAGLILINAEQATSTSDYQPKRLAKVSIDTASDDLPRRAA